MKLPPHDLAYMSRDLGLKGRVGLHSKADAEKFYVDRGFDPCEREATEDGTWLYFESRPENVADMLGEGT